MDTNLWDFYDHPGILYDQNMLTKHNSNTTNIATTKKLGKAKFATKHKLNNLFDEQIPFTERQLLNI